ncbi:hypothetical protein TYRP_015091 [Tyrophagus putrescentiae]|nr:hypothetical protein TYRP_015091 [Tyrophagus putrescentiae]
MNCSLASGQFSLLSGCRVRASRRKAAFSSPLFTSVMLESLVICRPSVSQCRTVSASSLSRSWDFWAWSSSKDDDAKEEKEEKAFANLQSSSLEPFFSAQY